MTTTTAEFTGRQVDLRKVLPYLLSIVVLTGAVFAGIAAGTQSVVEAFDWLSLIVVFVLVAAAPSIMSGGNLYATQKIHNFRNADY